MSRQNAQPFICEARMSTRWDSPCSMWPLLATAMPRSTSFLTSSGVCCAWLRRGWISAWLMIVSFRVVTPLRRSSLAFRNIGQHPLQLVGIALDVDRADAARLGGRGRQRDGLDQPAGRAVEDQAARQAVDAGGLQPPR